MKQTAGIISTYAADVSGVCSALYELGGMSVIHDASGCNSTYNTHDEPRWYDKDSMIFISGLSEMEAVMGDDEKLIGDITEAAAELHPAFIAIAGTPIPMMIGTDFPAIAALVEERTGIPAFGFATNGTHSYISGASLAFEAVAARLVGPAEKTPELSVNILGATPLDFSVNGSIRSLRNCLAAGGFSVLSCWAMDSDLAEIGRAAGAQVNLVVSASGLAAAETLHKRFGTPYVTGLPVAGRRTERLLAALKKAAAEQLCLDCLSETAGSSIAGAEIVIIGEGAASVSLAEAIYLETGRPARVICPLEEPSRVLRPGDVSARDEEELLPLLAPARFIIADPLYAPICPQTARLLPVPHEAFSGRIYRRDIPDFIISITHLLEELK